MLDTLFIVTSDPRRSHRPAEAIRIAAGVGAWKKVAAHLYLRGPAVLCLSEFPEEFVQGMNIRRYLPMLAESTEILAEEAAPEWQQVGESEAKFRRIGDGELAAFAARMRYTLLF